MFPPECSHSSVPMFPQKTVGTFFLRVPTKKTVGTFCKWRQNAMFPCSRLSFPIFCSQKTWEHVPKIQKNVPTAVASGRHVPTVPTVPTKK